MEKFHLDERMIARFLGLMLVAWQPFIGGPRIPSFLLFILGLWLLLRHAVDLSQPAVWRMGLVFLLLWIPVLWSWPGSFDPKGTLLIALALPLFFLAALALLHGFNGVDGLRWLNRWLLLVVMVWLLDGFFQWAVGVDLLGNPILADGRILGPFEDNLRLGLFVTLLLPLVAWAWARHRPLLALGLIFATGMIAGLSGARTNLFFLLLGVALLMPLFHWKYRAGMLLGLVLVGLAAISFSPVIAERLERFASIQPAKDSSLFMQVDHLLSGRLSIWNTARLMAADRPLTGVGAGGFEEAYHRYAPPDDWFSQTRPYHAHNMYVSVLAETGVSGLLVFALIPLLAMVWYRRAPSANRRLAAPYAMSLLVIAFPVSSQPILFSMWWFPVVLLLFTAMLAALQLPAPAAGEEYVR